MIAKCMQEILRLVMKKFNVDEHLDNLKVVLKHLCDKGQRVNMTKSIFYT